MYLTLDIGNTRTKFATFGEAGELLDWGSLETTAHVGGQFEHCKAIGFCNVSDEFSPDFGGFPGPIMELSSRSTLPFTNDYETPGTLGADRIAAVAGAMHLYPGRDTVVADAGTCLKFELTTADGVYRGGSISPGLQMRYAALKAFTGRLPLIVHSDFDKVAGRSTEESILCGVQQGFVHEVQGRIASFREQYPEAIVIFTGGDAGFLEQRVKTRIFAEPLLVHHGLYHCLRLNGY